VHKLSLYIKTWKMNTTSTAETVYRDVQLYKVCCVSIFIFLHYRQLHNSYTNLIHFPVLQAAHNSHPNLNNFPVLQAASQLTDEPNSLSCTSGSLTTHMPTLLTFLSYRQLHKLYGNIIHFPVLQAASQLTPQPHSLSCVLQAVSHPNLIHPSALL
jgi:hypothetical protein